MHKPVKVLFHLTQDVDGYPPVAVESLWARPTANVGEYVLDNIPFFARSATIGDVVRVREDGGDLWFEGLVRRSRSSLLRVVTFGETSVDEVSDRLRSLGCATEYAGTHKLLAVSVPHSAQVSEVRTYLRDQAAAGAIDYEEAILRWAEQ